MTARCLLSLALLLVVALPADARYRRPELANVPMERVIANLAKEAEAKPKDAAAKFKLARAYAMAYGSKKEEVQVRAGQENELWFGFEPKNQPVQAAPTEDKKVEEAARAQLVKAIAAYEAGLQLDSANLVGRLGYAWCLDQAKRTKDALAEYRKVIEAGWKKEGALMHAGLGFHSITAEAASYAIPLMDATADAAEIKELKSRIAKMEALPRPITPIAIPLRAGLDVRGIEDREATIAFDADGSAKTNQRWTWIKPTAGWLVMDKRGQGKIESGLQLFGNVTFWMFWSNGYEPLAALDDNGDGELRGRELAGLAIWCDANSNGVSEPGEVRPLSAHGIVALSCRYEVDAAHPDRIEFSRTGVTFADGTTRPSWDVKLHRK